MKGKQIVIRVARRGDFRGTDYSIITNDHVDIYARLVELGADPKKAQQLSNWVKTAKGGEIWGPKIVPILGDPMELTLKCHEPDRNVPELKRKRGRPRTRKE